MTVELYGKSGSPEHAFRIAQLRLTREMPASVRMASGTAVSVAWEGSPVAPR
jgi:hypothetical protein